MGGEADAKYGQKAFHDRKTRSESWGVIFTTFYQVVVVVVVLHGVLLAPYTGTVVAKTALKRLVFIVSFGCEPVWPGGKALG